MAKSGLKSLLKPAKKSSILKKLTKFPLTEIQKKPGHFDGKFWVWGDKKKTHINFIRMSMRTNRPLPPGFYKACAESGDPGLIKMGKVAEHHKLKEMI